MYGSRRFTYHQGVLSAFVNVQVSLLKNALVLPSIAFWGIPPESVLICMGALPAATFRTEKNNKLLKIHKIHYYITTIKP